jgi:hypothetical protein
VPGVPGVADGSGGLLRTRIRVEHFTLGLRT